MVCSFSKMIFENSGTTSTLASANDPRENLESDCLAEIRDGNVEMTGDSRNSGCVLGEGHRNSGNVCATGVSGVRWTWVGAKGVIS
ncbi:hypothetical protein OGAPHI_003892 [Ogataea philodendri]|uniref:Uncharacterized protein n=1 Tax=Ogataea philodendri TaxID=1378263 RepID=A0A9P8T4X6_9ASCO|nr:uncharacterized protein OGAPHI_003892 [Ogataea philodendri]KAH3665704.1 hypothetical protein OGAPHI_003892 [Ogataea philodendri]